MPSRTRRGIRASIAENPIQKAHDLEASSDRATFQKIWEDLCQEYRAALRHGRTFEVFPNWILRNIPHKVIPQMLEAVYGRGAKGIEFHAPGLCKRFGMPQWQFVLFLGSLSQPKVVALNGIARKRTDITFDSLYHELRQIRSKQQPLPDGPFNFKLAEFKSCLKTNNSGDEDESNSEVDYQNDDEANHGTIYVSSNEDDYDYDSEVNDEDDVEDTFGSPARHNEPPDSSNSVIIVLDEDVASPIRTTSQVPVLIPATEASDVRGSATDGATLIESQFGQGKERQDVELEVPEAGRLQHGELATDSITMAANYTRVDTQRQITCTDETSGQLLVDLCNTTKSLVNTTNSRANTANSLDNTADLLKKEHEELEQEEIAMRSRRTKMFNTAIQSIQLIFNSKSNYTPEQNEIEEANWSELDNLRKKRKIEQTEAQEHQAKCQEHQEKLLKLKADIEEFRVIAA